MCLSSFLKTFYASFAAFIFRSLSAGAPRGDFAGAGLPLAPAKTCGTAAKKKLPFKKQAQKALCPPQH